MAEAKGRSKFRNCARGKDVVEVNDHRSIGNCARGKDVVGANDHRSIGDISRPRPIQMYRKWGDELLPQAPGGGPLYEYPGTIPPLTPEMIAADGVRLQEMLHTFE
jgi:hypothetical protein